MNFIDDTNIEYIEELILPKDIKKQLPNSCANFILNSRNTIKNILNGSDNRLLCIVGPCSIHNYNEAIEYAKLLKKISDKVSDKLFIVMRTYFEKPRTTIGWKGFINDPNLDNSFKVSKGLVQSRSLLLEINNIGLPCATEILNSIYPQYISDLLSIGAIGARTTESQIHRQIVSGLSFPVGFKNSTDGNTQAPINSLISSKYAHSFMGISNEGIPSLCRTKGNNDTFLILRGSPNKPNYFIKNIDDIYNEYNQSKYDNINKSIIIDCSHDNSYKDYRNQKNVINYISKNIKEYKKRNFKGIMIESNINEGKQSLNTNLKYGISITDSCIDIQETEILLVSIYKIDF
jgi:3-deoxy-7-phosphoheptulonate synthase